jgi:arsenate reductase-like glutaredoxin family protein
MVTKKETIEKIREIIQKHYARLVVSVLGKDPLSDKELKELEEQGIDTSNQDSLLSLVYYHNFINHPVGPNDPKTVEEMKAQQSVIGLKPKGLAHDYTVESINDKTKQYIDKLKLDMMTRVEGIIRENNDSYKMNALQNLDRQDALDELVKESTLGKLRQKLRDTSGDGNRDWMRVAVTEMSNAIGIASVDRIVSDNIESPLDEVYVYRIIVKDAKTCKWCRRFYDEDDGPKLYRLSTLLGNGSNYGKKTDSWLPVVGATHPNERCSQMIELKPGFALNPDGSQTYIGLEKWKDYVLHKLQK